MNILVVDNGGAYPHEGRLCVNPPTSRFLHSIAECLPGTTYATVTGSRVSRGRFAIHPVETPGLECVVFRLEKANLLTKGISYLRMLGQVIRMTHNADFLYLFYPGNLTRLFLAVGSLLRKPYGLYLRGDGKFDLRRTRRAMRRAQFILATGQSFVELASGFCNNVEGVVPMGNLPHPDSLAPRTIKEHGPWSLLYVGNLLKLKGIPELLDAARILRSRGVDFHLKLVGANVLGITPESLGDLASCVTPTGPITDRPTLEQCYREADLFCFPSHTEGFPRVLYEAMAFQTPIVTTFVGGIGGTMKEDYNCLRVNVRDASHLADTIERALANGELRRRLASGGLETVMPILEKASRENHGTQLARKLREHLQSHE